MRECDVAVIGGGVLGAAVAYWMADLYDARICVVEGEGEVAAHASGRNTGVVHTPFYMDPDRRGAMAAAALASRGMWERFAARHGVPWAGVGTLEVAAEEREVAALERHMEWGARNGVPEGALRLLGPSEVSRMEPEVRCASALHCALDASTDYGALTRRLAGAAAGAGAELALGRRVASAGRRRGGIVLRLAGPGGVPAGELAAGLVVNCAGGSSLEVARMFGLAGRFSALHFRGEYWTADAAHSGLAGTNVYSVARFAGFPFLDPHWIRRADGRAEVGPNAVPVHAPHAYGRGLADVPAALSRAARAAASPGVLRLVANPEFLSLVCAELASSVSKAAMVGRVRRFMPRVEPGFFSGRGTAGIRTPVISPDGRFVHDAMELEGPEGDSFHIVNYNSPGATGAPAYAAMAVKKMRERGMLDGLAGRLRARPRGAEPGWDYGEASGALPGA